MSTSLCLLVLSTLSLAASQHVLFTGSPSYVSTADSKHTSIGDVAASLAALLSSPRPVPAETDDAQLASSSSVFDRPDAVLSLHLHGAGPEDVRGLLAGSVHSAELQQREESSVADPLAMVVKAARSVGSPLELVALEQGSLKGCSASCLQETLMEALTHVNATYEEGSAGPLSGTVGWQAAGASQADSLDLSGSEAGKLWAVELAALYRAGTDAAQEALRRQQQGRGASVTPPALLHATLLSPAALTASAGDVGSAQRAKQALVSVASVVQERLQQAYSNRLVTHLTLERGQGGATADWTRLLAKRTAQTRRRLASVRDKGPSDASTDWFVQAVAWGSGIVLLAFILAGVCVMTNMPFKEDSLLYARPKAE